MREECGMDRVWKFGLITATGVTFVSVMTGWIIWREYTTTIAGSEPAWFLMLIIGVAGLTVNMLFLFLVIGEYVNRELEARGVASTEE